MDVGCTLDFG